ncbi:MAG: AI-2E family transporter [Nanoarchaeota archaeon]
MDTEKVSTLTFFVVLLVLLILSAFIIRPLFAYIILGFVLAYIFRPLHKWLYEKTQKKNFSATTITILILIVLVIPALSLLYTLFNQAKNAWNGLAAFSTTLGQLSTYLSHYLGKTIDLQVYAQGIVSRIAQFVVEEKGPSFISDVGDIILGLFVMFMVMFYMFRGGRQFFTELRELIPLKRHHKIKLFSEIESMLHAVIYGQILIAIVQGVLLGIGLFVAGVPNAYFWTFVSIIICFIPYIGTPIIFVPASLYLFLSGHTGAAIGLLIYGFVIVTNIDNIIRPRIIGKRAKVHPLLVLLGVIGGLKLFGFIGLIIGPLVLSLVVVFLRFYAQDFIAKES